MIFLNQANFYVLSPDTNYCWIRKPIEVVDEEYDYERPETDWAKIVRINRNEWLCLMGAKQTDRATMGTKLVTKLNI